ncbi:hypothetical protein HOG47_02240 [archaeon]|nr:hypothetical protein [archaeon]
MWRKNLYISLLLIVPIEMNKSRIVLVTIVFLLTLSIAFAQNYADDFATFAEPIAGLIESYMKDDTVSLVIDLIIYIWIFVKFVPHQLKDKWGDGAEKWGKGLGFMLAIAMISGEYSLGFRIVKFFPVVIGLLVIWVIDAISGGQEELKNVVNPFRLAILMFVLSYLFEILHQWFQTNLMLTISTILRMVSWILLTMVGIHAIMKAVNQGRAEMSHSGDAGRAIQSGLGGLFGIGEDKGMKPKEGDPKDGTPENDENKKESTNKDANEIFSYFNSLTPEGKVQFIQMFNQWAESQKKNG